MDRRATATLQPPAPPLWPKPERAVGKHLDEALLAALRRHKADASVQPGVPFN